MRAHPEVNPIAKDMPKKEAPKTPTLPNVPNKTTPAPPAPKTAPAPVNKPKK